MPFDPPLLPNGKIDRRLLEEWADRERDPNEMLGQAVMLPSSSSGDGSGMGGLTAVEQTLALLWQEVLQLPVTSEGNTLSPQAHFFELGGSSLLAVQMVTRLKSHPAFSGARMGWGWGASHEIEDAELHHQRLCGLINQPRLRGFAAFLEREKRPGSSERDILAGGDDRRRGVVAAVSIKQTCRERHDH